MRFTTFEKSKYIIILLNTWNSRFPQKYPHAPSTFIASGSGFHISLLQPWLSQKAHVIYFMTHITRVFIFFNFICWLASKRENVLFHLFMHSLVDSCKCPDGRSNLRPWCVGGCSNLARAITYVFRSRCLQVYIWW